MMIDPRLASALIAAALIVVPTSAQAQPRDGSSEEGHRKQAARLFDQGHIAFRGGKYERAILKWQESYALSKEPLILFNIGMAFEKLGELDEALVNFRRWREHAPEQEHAELDARIERLERERAEAGLDDADSVAEPEPDTPEGPDDPPSDPGESAASSATIAGYSLLGIGGAAVVIGIAMDIAALSMRPGSEGCVRESERLLCLQDQRAAIDQSNTLAIAGDVTWITGAALATTGIILLLVDATPPDEGPGEGDLSLAPVPLPGGAAVTLRAWF